MQLNHEHRYIHACIPQWIQYTSREQGLPAQTVPPTAKLVTTCDNTQRNKGTTLAGLNFSTTQHSFAQTLQVHRDKGPNLSTHVSKTRQNYSKLLRPTDRISRCLNYIHIITYNCNIVIVSIKIAFSKVRCAKQITWCMLMKVDAAGH